MFYVRKKDGSLHSPCASLTAAERAWRGMWDKHDGADLDTIVWDGVVAGRDISTRDLDSFCADSSPELAS